MVNCEILLNRIAIIGLHSFNYFIFYFIFILQDSPHQTNIKLIQISTSALAGTDHRDKLQ
jgi:hypothetical protein